MKIQLFKIIWFGLWVFAWNGLNCFECFDIQYSYNSTSLPYNAHAHTYICICKCVYLWASVKLSRVIFYVLLISFIERCCQILHITPPAIVWAMLFARSLASVPFSLYLWHAIVTLQAFSLRYFRNIFIVVENIKGIFAHAGVCVCL